MAFRYINFAETELAEAIEPTDTTIRLRAPFLVSLEEGDLMPIVLSDGNQSPEIVYATAGEQYNFIVERGQEQTPAQRWLTGTNVKVTPTAESLSLRETDFHGVDTSLSNAQAGSVDTQLLDDEAVTEDKLGEESVTQNKIANGAIYNQHMTPGCVGNANLRESDKIDGNKLKDGLLALRHFPDGLLPLSKFDVAARQALGEGAEYANRSGDNVEAAEWRARLALTSLAIASFGNEDGDVPEISGGKLGRDLLPTATSTEVGVVRRARQDEVDSRSAGNIFISPERLPQVGWFRAEEVIDENTEFNLTLADGYAVLAFTGIERGNIVAALTSNNTKISLPAGTYLLKAFSFQDEAGYTVRANLGFYFSSSEGNSLWQSVKSEFVEGNTLLKITGETIYASSVPFTVELRQYTNIRSRYHNAARSLNIGNVLAQLMGIKIA